MGWRMLVLALVAASLPGAATGEPTEGTWAEAGSLTEGRHSPTTTVLADGRVLVAGGRRGENPLSSAELYDPASGSWTTVASMSTPRRDHAAALLPDGRVLVAGGSDGTQILATTEIFDPNEGTWTPDLSLADPRRGHQLSVLDDGSILLTGGATSTRCPEGPDGDTQLRDPATGEWQVHGSLIWWRVGHTAHVLPGNKVLVLGGRYIEAGTHREGIAVPELYDVATATTDPGRNPVVGFAGHTGTVLPDGRVLVVGGCCYSAPGVWYPYSLPEEIVAADAAIYDPMEDVWTPTRPMGRRRAWHSATLLDDGRVLIAGGAAIRPGTFRVGMRTDIPLREAEIYDPATDVWTNGGTLHDARFDHVAFTTPVGDVIVTGGIGEDHDDPHASSERFVEPAEIARSNPTVEEIVVSVPSPQPSTAEPRIHGGSWRTEPDLPLARLGVSAALLEDGRILVAGGQAGAPYPAPSARADLYDPAQRRWTQPPPMQRARTYHTASVLDDGRVLVVGGSPNANTAEIFDPSTMRWSMTAPMTRAYSAHTATVLRDGRVLVAGGSGAGCGSDASGAEIYDPDVGTWTTAARMNIGRGGHAATLLADGRVLVSGGFYDMTAEIYDPDLDRWDYARQMNAFHHHHTSHLLPDGRVLVVGGCCTERPGIPFDDLIPGGAIPSPAEIYDPVANVWTFTPPMRLTRFRHAATAMRDGSIMVLGGLAPSVRDPIECERFYCQVETTEIFEPVTGAWQEGPTLAGARYDHAAVTLRDGRVFTSGGAQINTDGRPGYLHTVAFSDLYER